MDSLQQRPYLFAVGDRPDEEVHEAFYECFATAAGQIVLDRLYWQVMMREPDDLRGVGQQDLFRFVVQCIQLGWARKRGGQVDGDGYQYHAQ